MKINLLLIATFISVIIFAERNFETGHIGLTRLNGNGCLCHGIEFTDSVHVWIEGPDSLLISDSVEYKVLITGGPAVAGGFNIAVRYGTIDSVDTLSHRMLFSEGFPLELTHTMPNTFKNDTVFWSFKYTAPNSIVVDTIYSVANSVNGDGNPILGDKWNFGENFPVRVIDIPVTVEDEILPSEFQLAQNYPNPFNPGTSIEYTVSSRQYISLKVYDILGNEVASLVNEEKPSGTYQVRFNGTQLSSGVYIYKLETKDIINVKKMLMIK